MKKTTTTIQPHKPKTRRKNKWNKIKDITGDPSSIERSKVLYCVQDMFSGFVSRVVHDHAGRRKNEEG